MYSYLDINLLFVWLQVKNTQLNFTYAWKLTEFRLKLLGVSGLTEDDLKAVVWLTVPWGGLIVSLCFVWMIPKNQANVEVNPEKQEFFSYLRIWNLMTLRVFTLAPSTPADAPDPTWSRR